MTARLDSNRTVTAVPGVEAAHWTNAQGTTGTTVVLFPNGARAGHAVLGPAAGTRDFAALDPQHPAGEIHGVCFAGGSSFGLAAVDGVLELLRSRAIGFDSGHGRIPVVPGAIIFDLDTSESPPDRDSGRAAAAAASAAPLPNGRAGAGAGAAVARMLQSPIPAGVAGWAERWHECTVGALVILNSLGAVRDPADGAWIAGGPVAPVLDLKHGGLGRNTTLALVCTDVALSRTQLTTVARMASAGIARTIYPTFTPLDGDVVIAASTVRSGRTASRDVSSVGHLAAECVAQAVVRLFRHQPRVGRSQRRSADSKANEESNE